MLNNIYICLLEDKNENNLLLLTKNSLLTLQCGGILTVEHYLNILNQG